MIYDTARTEFGLPRTMCACDHCRSWCNFMPGCLIPSDLERMIPSGVDPFEWAESNLLASPGALVMKGYRMFRIHTLVPAVKPDGSCIHLIEGRCNIHAVAPFGCAYFDCGPDTGVSRMGLIEICKAGSDDLYPRLWAHLEAKGLTQRSAETLRTRFERTPPC
jgi:hypothetical protein